MSDLSEWKQGAAKRRDARATKDEPRKRRVHRRKDTVRWCRGKVGVEHVTETVAKFKLLPTYVVDRCVNCGKEMRFRETQP